MGVKRFIGSKIAEIATDIGRYIVSKLIYQRFWLKNAILVWMCQIVAARCRKRNIGAILEIYRGYLEYYAKPMQWICLLSTTMVWCLSIIVVLISLTILNSEEGSYNCAWNLYFSIKHSDILHFLQLQEQFFCFFLFLHC